MSLALDHEIEKALWDFLADKTCDHEDKKQCRCGAPARRLIGKKFLCDAHVPRPVPGPRWKTYKLHNGPGDRPELRDN